MSMPTKGKHHLGHHQHQSHHSHLQSQHILGVNINQSAAPSVSHSSQHYNPAILNNSTRFVSHTGSDFHVSGQNFSAQPSGPVGGGGSSVGIGGARGPPLGSVQTIVQTTTGTLPGVPTSGQPQPTPGSGIQQQPSQGPSTVSVSVHNQPSQEMNKQTHLQTQPPTMPQVYVQNSNRSTPQQNYYPTGPRPQQPRNLSHRNAQVGNQSQVVGMSGVGAVSGQPAALYPHHSIAIQPNTIYVQSQVQANLHTNPHQQNMFSMNNQIPMQYSGGPPQRHQTHQNQFQYQSFQHPPLLASGLFGYGAQHPGYFYQQTPNAQVHLNRTNANTVSSSTQHISGPLNNPQGTAIVPQGSIQQPTQQPQALHTMNLSLSQNDIYPSFNSNHNNSSTRSRKPRTKAITDIVNPNTGKNISAEIYKDATVQSEESSNRESPQSSKDAEVVAEFASRVAQLASESKPSSPTTEPEKFPLHSQVSKTATPQEQDTIVPHITDIRCSKHSQFINNPNPTANVIPSKSEIESSKAFETVLEFNLEEKVERVIPNDEKLTSCVESDVLENVFTQESDLIISDKENIQALSDTGITSVTNYQNIVPDDSIIENNPEVKSTSMYGFEEKHSESPIVENVSCTGSVSVLMMEPNDEDLQKQVNGESNLEMDTEKNENQLKSVDGKNMQKQKNKSKLKGRDLNRRGVEKEGTDMDAFVNPNPISTSSVNIETKQDTVSQKDNNKEETAESMKNIKEKDNYESKKEKDISEIHRKSNEKNISNVDDGKENISSTEKEPTQKSTIKKEDNLEETGDDVSVIKDNTDYITVFRDEIDKETVPQSVVQKNEENSKVSGLVIMPKEEESSGDTQNPNIVTATKTLSLKYTYSDDQWSPINTSGKKIYDRNFLMNLQHDPNSKIKPSNLPDLEVVLKDNTKTRSPVDLRFKDANLGRHDSLFPGFVKSSLGGAKVPPPSKKSHSGKPKPSKPNVIHVSLSLREDVKLRETENAWKPTRLVQGSISEEQAKTDALYKRVRSVLNKLTPQKFNTLVNQVRELQIDTQERLQGVIDLVFEKAVDEPNFSVAYALMCKELSNMQVTGGESEESNTANFRKLILTRCQTEFEKNTADENARIEKLKEVEECTDPERKKELQINFDEEERQIRVKSVGNIRFIGELFKQNMLTGKIMHQCIRHLLKQLDEENLECLCKLLSTIGKVLESKSDLSDYFKQMQQIASRKGKVSSRIRFMLQDVIDLRANKWIPRRDDSNPKTMDQIQREAESERLDIQLNNATLSTPRKDERVNERKRNRGGAGSMIEPDGWSQVGVSRPRPPTYSVETAKLKNKPPSMDDMQLGSRSNYQWAKPMPNPKMTTPNKFSYLENMGLEPDKRVASIHPSGSRSTGPRDYGHLDYKSNYDGRTPRNGNYQLSGGSYSRDNSVIESSRSQSISAMPSSKSASQATSVSNEPQLKEEDFKKALNSVIEEYTAGKEDIQEAVKLFRSTFPEKFHTSFVQEVINTVLEKSDYHRNKTSQLLAQLLLNKYISLLHFKEGMEEIFKVAPELIIDIPRLWIYIAEILVHPVVNGAHPLSDFKTTLQSLSSESENSGFAAELIAALLSEIAKLKGNAWTVENWMKSGLQWSDFVNDQSKIEDIITKYKLDFLTTDQCINYKNDNITSLNMEKIHDTLLELMKNSDFDNICDWIQSKVKDVKEPKFIRILMTAILETCVEECNEKWTFKGESFERLQKLIQRFVDADEHLEVQCLYALQAFDTKLQHPAGLIRNIVSNFWENNVISNEAYLAWEKSDDPAERDGKAVALVSLKTFFIPLKEGDNSSGDETSYN